PRRGRHVRGAAVNADEAGHDVLRRPASGVAVDDDSGPLVQPGRVVADVPVDVDLDVGVQPDGDVVRPRRVVDVHAPHRGRGGREVAVQPGVYLAQTLSRQVEPDYSAGAFHEYSSSGFGSKRLASAMPGRWASERNSEATAR